MLDRLISRLQFLRKSSNQHGVHSPFVYRYLTEGIYQTKKHYPKLSKSDRLLQASIAYFQIPELRGEVPSWVQACTKPIKTEDRNTYASLHYIADIELLSLEEIKSLKENTKTDSLLYIAKPYKTKKSRALCLDLYSHKAFHLSIDFYYAGVLATRIEQEKEHFTLRM